MTDAATPLRLLVIGHGRMGRLVERFAPELGFEIVECLDGRSNAGAQAIRAWRWSGVDVAVDFSTADATLQNVPLVADRGANLVIGTTGWLDQEAELRAKCDAAGIGVVAASNFSVGVAALDLLLERAASIFDAQAEYGAWIHEAHHAAKRDAPSGTALTLERTLRRSGYRRAVDVASTRAGHVPGTHTVGFDGPFESVTLTHATRDRATFARGALAAARWVAGRRGWYGMRDVLGWTQEAPR